MSTDQVVVIWGELLWDRFPDGDRLGGAPANVAWHLGLAGGAPMLVTRVGDDDDGRRAVGCVGELCDTSLVQVDHERATGEVRVAIEAGEPRYTLVRDRAWERIECTDAVREALADASVLVYGTLAQRTAEGLASWRAAIAASSACIKVCDVNLRKVPHGATTDDERTSVLEAVRVADVLKVNDRELATIASWHGWSDPLAELRRGRKVVAVTHGANGSTLYGDAHVLAIPPHAARTGGDHVGCGDAYLAILVFGMTRGWDLAASGVAASRWAAAVAGERGATPFFDDARVAELLGVEAAA